MVDSAQKVSEGLQNWGGQDQPYPDSIVECTDEMEIRRIALFQENGATVYKLLKPDSPFQSNYSDPSVEQSGNLPQKAEYVGLCQKQLTDNPARYGLFWVLLSSSPFTDWRDNQNTADFQSALEANDSLVNALPEWIRQCKLPVQEMEGREQTVDELQYFQREAILRQIDPFVMAEVPFVANAIWMDTGMAWLFEINEAQENALHDTVAFALGNGISEDDIMELAAQISSKEYDEYYDGSIEPEDVIDHFVYKLLTIISLRVGELLDWENRGNGGISPQISSKEYDECYDGSIEPEDVIDHFVYKLLTIISLRIGELLDWENHRNGEISPDFYQFSRAIEDKILNGDLHIRVMSIADAVAGPTLIAFYDHISNTMIFQPLDKDVFAPLSFDTLIHECYHAFQDMKRRPMALWESEYQATSISTKANMLLARSSFYSGYNSSIRYADSQFRERRMIQSEMKRQERICLGMPEESLILEDEISRMESEGYKVFIDVLKLETMGVSDSSAELLFREYYKYSMLNKITQRYGNQWSINVGTAYYLGLLKNTHITLEDIRARLAKRKKEFYTAEPGTPERAQEAREYYSERAHMVALLIFTNPELLTELYLESAKSADLEKINELAEALLYFPVNPDGL